MTRLDSSPAILPLYLKAALPLLPGASALPFVPGGSSEIPDDLEFELEGVVPDPGQVSAYARVCGFTLRETLPPTFPHILAFPLHMAIMSDGAFPFGAVGLVHVENSITQHRPIGFEEELDIKVRPTALETHPKGRVFSLLTEVSVAGELVWSETSTMLRRGKADGEALPKKPKEVDSPEEEPPASATWQLPGDLGRRYGAVSGDRNPIHMHSFTAKPLGFKAAIAHGMWTNARALAQIETRLPDSFMCEVRFRRPIFLPARVEFGAADSSDEISFFVRDAHKAVPHLDGFVRTLPDNQKASTPR